VAEAGYPDQPNDNQWAAVEFGVGGDAAAAGNRLDRVGQDQHALYSIK
jgi:hypothetical protein